MKEMAHDLVSVKANLCSTQVKPPARRPEPTSSRGPLLDHDEDARVGWVVDIEAALTRFTAMNAKTQRRKDAEQGLDRGLVDQARWITPSTILSFATLRLGAFALPR